MNGAGIRLSTHFSLAELLASETADARALDNTPGPQALINLARLAQVLEEVRGVLAARPVIVTSGFRSEGLNKWVGGSRTSAHMDGRAADIVCPAFGNPLKVAQRLQIGGIAFDQLIYERFGAREWVHVGIARIGEARRQQVFSIIDGRVKLGLG
ncbi:peptidase M15 [Thauera sp. UPWRP]|nr:peptidase M15 [Thauera sp. UPWRP]